MDKKLKGLMFNEDKARKNEEIDGVLFVDPGLGGTGWAYFDQLHTDGRGKRLTRPAGSGVIRAPKNEQWDNRVWSYCSMFNGVLTATGAKLAVFEFPELFSGSSQSHASAAKGDLFKLTYLVGGLADRARERTGKLPILITPMDWKGQLPKDVVIDRIKDAYGEDYKVRDHEGDAIGMGLSAQGRL